MSPFTAWIMLNGMVTLDLRCRAMAEGALAVARALEGDARLSRVIYPGLASHPQADLAARQMGSGGTLLAFDIEGGKEAAFRFMNALKIIKISNNLGDAKTIATHPATTTHQRLAEDQKQKLGITPGLIRLSVGLEDPGDLIADLKAALAMV
jgi:O-succinylhomoserine sulfhydrylase